VATYQEVQMTIDRRKRYRSRIALSMLSWCDKMRPSIEVATSFFALHATYIEAYGGARRR
jgi:hypothetical protein